VCGWIKGSTPCTATWPDVAKSFAGIQKEEWPSVTTISGHCVDAWCPMGFNEPFNRTVQKGEGGYERNEGAETVLGCPTPPNSPTDKTRYCCYPRENAWLQNLGDIRAGGTPFAAGMNIGGSSSSSAEGAGTAAQPKSSAGRVASSGVMSTAAAVVLLGIAF